MIARRVSLSVLLAGSLAILICSVIDHPVSRVAFAVTTMAFPPALIALGALRRGRLGGLAVPLLLFAILLQGCVLAMLVLSAGADSESRWLGLPPATAVMLYGLWLFTLVLVSLLFAWDFDRFAPGEEDLRRIRRIAERRADRTDGD
jgi:hypothetical protein